MSSSSAARETALLVTASARRAGASAESEVEEVVRESLARLRSIRSLGAVMAKTPTIPAGLARTAQASENAWRQIELEFGMLTSTEVARRIGSRSPHRNLASDMRQKGALLGVNRLNSFRYPGFQFTDDGSVHAAMHPLLLAARDADWSAASLTLWLCSPSGAFDGDRPVDHLADPSMVDVARDVMATDW